jgi:hypothetical protein
MCELRFFEPGLRGCRNLIQGPSWGEVLSAIGPEADGGVRILRGTLVGLDAPVCVPAAAEITGDAGCAAAELFTSSRGSAEGLRLARW